MRETLISVTVAARKFSDCISRVRYQGASFLLEKNGVPVARIIPVQTESTTEDGRAEEAIRALGPAPSDFPQSEPVSLSFEKNGTESSAEKTPAQRPTRPRLNW